MVLRAVMFGPPGVGKGTQAAVIADRYDIPHISTGDIFRKNIREETPLGKRAAEFINRGNLVPDDVTVDLVTDRLQQPDCSRGFILDGFPRTVAQFKALEHYLALRNTPLDIVLYIHAPDHVLVERISGRRSCKKCGANFHIRYKPSTQGQQCDHCGDDLYQRDDDKEDVVTERLRQYREMSTPLIALYRDGGLLVEIDGGGSTDVVSTAVLTALENRDHVQGD